MSKPSKPPEPAIPPKPPSRPDDVSLWQYVKLFRRDILSAQPARLFHAWMAEFRTPFFRSFLVNQPALVRLVLKERPRDFPKSDRVNEGLRPLLGQSVFVTNGEIWERQRRIIDPAFEGGRLRDTFPAMQAAASACISRLTACEGQPIEFEEQASHVAADVIFRTLFSMPIEDETASQVFHRFREYQNMQPIVNAAAFVQLPRWFPRLFRPKVKAAAREIRRLIGDMTSLRQRQIEEGVAPDDLATKIMTTRDPVTGEIFGREEMVDQVAIFFLAGHETSAAALGWTLYLLATNPMWQDRVAEEVCAPEMLDFGTVARLKLTRDVFHEALRLYPPVPMMVREATCPEHFRDRDVPVGSQIVLSPWHLHRHDRLWENPDAFDPGRWQLEETRATARDAFIPFSAGARACTGAGFAMLEGQLLLAEILRRFRVEPVAGKVPEPEAHLTIRSRTGIWLRFVPRDY